MTFVLIGLLCGIGLFASMLVASEAGRRIGVARLARHADGLARGGASADAATFALMGLLIAFTFSGAASRFQDRRDLIADEAMAGLSHSEVDEIVQLLLRLNREQGITIILIEHIMSAVMQFSERLIVFVSGRKIADGAPEEVVRNPDVESAYLGQ